MLLVLNTPLLNLLSSIIKNIFSFSIQCHLSNVFILSSFQKNLVIEYDRQIQIIAREIFPYFYFTLFNSFKVSRCRPRFRVGLISNKFIFKAIILISCHWSLSVLNQNIRKSLSFSGGTEKNQ